MDILIDLIIFLIKRAAKSQQGQATPARARELERQQAVLARQVQAFATQMARTAPVRTAAQGRVVRPKPPSWAQPAVSAVVPPVMQPPVPPVATAPARQSTISPRVAAMQFPFLLGEVLGPPVALDEPEF